MSRSYYAIIPAPVRYSSALCPNAKLLYGEITALCNERGYCWATNKYFSDLYEVKPDTISEWVKQLKAGNFIRVEIDPAKGNVRKIFLCESIPPLPDKKPIPPTGQKTDTSPEKTGDINNKENITGIPTGTPNADKPRIGVKGGRVTETVSQSDLLGYVFQPPFNASTFYAAIERWRVHKGRRAEAFTRYALERLLKKCAKQWTLEKAIEAIDYSIQENWQGVYPPKASTVNSYGRPTAEQRVEKDRASTYETDRQKIAELNRQGLAADMAEIQQESTNYEKGEYTDEG